MIIGLTGGIASGKSTVARLLQERGFPVIDADVAARKVVEKGQPALNQIVEAFGREVLTESGELDRPKLGSIIFYDEEKRKKLNAIVHPAVRAWMKEQQELAQKEGHKTIFLDIPLLFESELQWMVEKIIVVFVDESTQRERLMARNDLNEDDANARIRSQLPLSEKAGMADAVIDNNDSPAETEHRLDRLLESWSLQPEET